ncbi:MAG: anthrax toxin-like adenylyl cyclase domain-containing protein, partial [Thermodesulfobacteriota bacterium]
AEATQQEYLKKEFKFLDKKSADVIGASLSSLATIEVEVVNKITEDRTRFSAEKDRAWNETLNANIASFTDIEAKRVKLKSEIEIWTTVIDATELKEIGEGLAIALAIAKHDKLDVIKMKDIYTRMKELIRGMKYIDLQVSVGSRTMEDELKLARAVNAFNTPFGPKVTGVDLEAPRQVTEAFLHKIKNLDGSQLSTRFVKLFFWGFPAEELIARSRQERQEIRVRLYKRTTIAFMRALISGMDPVQECSLENQKAMVGEYKGQRIPSFGCPDPVVENLWKYHSAITKIRTAESDRLQAEIEMIIAEQQFVGDLIGLIPVVGDWVDFSYVVMGEDINGIKLTPTQRTIMGLCAVVPVVGPKAFEQAMKRSKLFNVTMTSLWEGLTWWKEGAYVAGRGLASVAGEVTELGIKELAQRLSIKPEELKKLMKFLENNPLEVNDAAKARMKRWRVITEASNNKLTSGAYKKAIKELPKTEAEILAKTMEQSAKRSKTVLNDNLMARQGTREQLIIESNMVESHVNAYEKVVKRPGKRKIVLVRPVSGDATGLLAADIAAPKPFTIKPKSSDHGAARGFVPIEQKFSKLGNPAGPMDAGVIAEYSEKSIKAQKTIKHVPLKREFKDKFGNKMFDGEELHAVIVKRGDLEITAFKRPSNGELIDPDTLKPLNMKNIDVTNQRALRVFADKNGVPYTADYDLLDIGFQSKDGPPFFPKLAGDKVTMREGHGVSTDRIDAAIKELNAEGVPAGYTKGDLIQHAPERYNPNTAGIDFRPPGKGMPALHVTAIDPDYGVLNIPFCDGDCMRKWCRTTGMCNPASICPPGKILGCVLPDKDRLIKDYYHNAKMRGINLTPNEAWGWGRYNKLGGWTMTGYQGGLPASFNIAKDPSSTAQKVISHLQGKLLGKSYNSLFGRLMRLKGYYDIRCKSSKSDCYYYG